ncbi:MAG: c-type cytochrome [Vicinamibacterales bacterium]
MAPSRATVLKVICACGLAASACSGVQSSLSPAGREAGRIAMLFWWMAGGALIAWVATIAVALYYYRRSPHARDRRRDRTLIIGGGVLVPTITLTLLLVYGLAMLPDAVARAPDGSQQVLVQGEQWWWRVRYVGPGGDPIDLANEVRLPVGRAVQFHLESDNVIHSFWIPSLAGKMDMIPGRVTHLAIRPTATGRFRGACAEYCGTSHALMAFAVDVMDGEAFDRWLEHQAEPASAIVEPLASRGERLFLENGCDGCHAVRGTRADGVIGPDLTHVGGRRTLAAGILPNDLEALRRWIAGSERIKPGAHMPSFSMLPSGDLRALAAYLHALD